MRFLVDQNLSSRFADQFRRAGHDVVHTGDVGLATADDDIVLARAAAEDRVLVSADTEPVVPLSSCCGCVRRARHSG